MMNMKTPEERRAIAAKGNETKRRNREAREELRKDAEARRLYLKCEIEELERQRDELERQRDELPRHRIVYNISLSLTGKTLLTERDIIAGAVGFDNICGVYFLIKNERVVYVGQSSDIFVRVSTHSKEKDFDELAYIKVSPELLNKVESLYIHTLQPPLNGNQSNGIKCAPLSLDALLKP